MSDKIIKQLESFNDCQWALKGSIQKDPSCFNCEVRIKKYRITVEEIEEPLEVYQERLEKLNSESGNHHDMLPLTNKAAELGIVLKTKWNSVKKR
jgi:hypothetical protein